MPAVTQKMVNQSWDKVNYVKWLIKRVYETGSNIYTFPVSIDNIAARKAIAQADLIVVATDNHSSRKLAQELAIEYARPVVSLGTHIDINEEGQTKIYSRVTVPPVGGDWCLMCGNVIDLQQAALESAPSQVTQIAEDAGYLSGVEDPAVYWLNSICASTGVGVVHGMLSGFINLDSGLDWIYDFSNSNWLKTNTAHFHSQDCYFCASHFSNLTDEEVPIHEQVLAS